MVAIHRVITEGDVVAVACVMLANLLVARYGIWPYSLATLPGTVAHELTHWFVAKLFFARFRNS